ncbi:MAG: hypothetical protein JSV33_13540 [bacterium]|nr:MAG: hypothetical protein JSV33_13540 [bacterium]
MMIIRCRLRNILFLSAMLLMIGQVSCKKRELTGFPLLPVEETRAGGGIAVAAHLIADEGEIEDIFHLALPDSGIVPVCVTVQNNDILPVWIHTANAMELEGSFDGFVLEAGGDTHFPLHPLDVLMLMRGLKKAARYKSAGSARIAVSMAVAPPLGLFYLFRELRVGRHLRNLSGRSLYPVLASGLMEPVLLEPGEERSGYCYFFLPKELSPYRAVGNGSPKMPVRLLVRASASIAPSDTFRFHDCRLARVDGWKWGAVEGDTPCSDLLFAIRAPDSKSGNRLIMARLSDLAHGSDRSLVELATIASKSAGIADVSARGGRVACAVNFRSKSRVYLFSLGESPELIKSERFSKRIDRIFLVGDGMLVISGGKHCRFLSGDALHERRSIRFGYDVADAMLLDEHLYVFHEKRGIRIYGASKERMLRHIERKPLPAGRRRVVATLGNRLVLVHQSQRSVGDTLMFFSRETKMEADSVPLPGAVAFAGTIGDGCIVQLEDGTALVFRVGSSGVPELEDALYLPFRMQAISRTDSRLNVISKEGLYVTGYRDDFRPGTHSVLKAETGIEFAPGRNHE